MMSIIVSKLGSAARNLCADLSSGGDCPLSPQDEGNDKVGALLDEYEQSLAGKAQGTKQAYLRTVHHLMGWVAQLHGNAGQFQPSQLTKSVVEWYLTHLEHEGFSLPHCMRVKAIIRHFVRFLIDKKGLRWSAPWDGA